jgi:hypothetical protein
MTTYNVKWTCPKCGAENEADAVRVLFPLCEGCVKNTEWSDILTAEEQAEVDAAIAKTWESWW